VAGRSGTVSPSKVVPVVAPSAPGYVPKKWSKVRFSLITNTTCSIGMSSGSSTGGGGSVGRLDGSRGPGSIFFFARPSKNGFSSGVPGSGTTERDEGVGVGVPSPVQATPIASEASPSTRSRKAAGAPARRPPRSFAMSGPVWQRTAGRLRAR
jgi:hypothetical protein